MKRTKAISLLVMLAAASFALAQLAETKRGGFLPHGTPDGFGTVPDETAPVLMATRVVSGNVESFNGETVSATAADTSVLLAKDGATVSASKATFGKNGGDTSNDGQSNFYGLNAAVVAQGASSVGLQQVTVTSDANGANALFATGKGTVITAKGVTVRTSKDSSRGLDATYGGTILAEKVAVETKGAHAAAFATDRGEGTITVNGGTASTAGEGSPVIYSTGDITIKNLTGKATGSEIAVIEGKNTITLEKVQLTGGTKNGREAGSAVMLYQSMSGDANRGTSTFTARNSALTSTSDGAFFYVTNTQAVINLTGVKLTNPTDTLLQASGNESERGWGRRGENGGTVTLNATRQTLVGNIVVDDISQVTLNLGADAQFTGALNTEHAGTVNLTLAKKATLTLTADSYVNELSDDDPSFKNIVTGGHTLYYNKNAKANADLKGRTILLKDGGKLVGTDGKANAKASDGKAKNGDGTKIPLPARDKTAPNTPLASRPDRPHGELTTLSGTLTYIGKTDSAATLVSADGKTTVLKVPVATERKDDRAPNGKGGFGKNGAPNGNARPPLPADTNGARKQPPKPVTLDDLKKLDGKSVEVKGALDKDGNLLVFAATNLQSE